MLIKIIIFIIVVIFLWYIVATFIETKEVVDEIYDEKSNENYNPKFHRTNEENNLSHEFSKEFGSRLNSYENKWFIELTLANKERDLNKQIELYNNTIAIYDEAKDYAYSKGEGGKIYFDDMWEHCHNAANPCFSYRDYLTENIREIESYITKMKKLSPKMLEFISANSGFIQKDIYPYFPDVDKSTIQELLKYLEKENYIIRNKKSNSYELFISN